MGIGLYMISTGRVPESSCLPRNVSGVCEWSCPDDCLAPVPNANHVIRLPSHKVAMGLDSWDSGPQVWPLTAHPPYCEAESPPQCECARTRKGKGQKGRGMAAGSLWEVGTETICLFPKGDRITGCEDGLQRDENNFLVTIGTGVRSVM
jgi:hypothetical protein